MEVMYYLKQNSAVFFCKTLGYEIKYKIRGNFYYYFLIAIFEAIHLNNG